MKKSIENLLKDSPIDKSWVDKEKWKIENERWLDVSFTIAVNILSKLRANKKLGISPKNQVELSDMVKCTPQYVNKILRGKENLQLETICKFENVLRIKLIEPAKSYESDLICLYSKTISEQIIQENAFELTNADTITENQFA